jgi:hypothetical protein
MARCLCMSSLVPSHHDCIMESWSRSVAVELVKRRVLRRQRKKDDVFYCLRLMLKEALWCSTQIQDTQTRDNKLTWTTGEFPLQFVLPVCAPFACLVTLVMDAGASKGFSAFRTNFINKSQHMLHTDRCVIISGSRSP